MESKNSPTVRRGAAELVVIVAGVLLALAADRWIESLDARGLESEYLAQLIEDVAADSAAFAMEIAGRQRRIEWNARLQVALAGESPVPTDAAAFLVSMNYYSAWVPYQNRRETWNELVATGRLILIRDRSLRQRLGQYYSEADRAMFGFEQMDRELADIKAVIEQVLEPETRLAMFGSPDRRTDVTQAEVAAVLDRIRADRALRSGFVSAEERHRNIVREYEQALVSAGSLLKLLRADAL